MSGSPCRRRPRLSSGFCAVIGLRPHGLTLTAVSTIPASDDVLDAGEPVYDLPTVAELLRIPVTKVHQRLRDGQLVAVRRDGIPVVPRLFFTVGGEVTKPLPGLLAVLRDGVEAACGQGANVLGDPRVALTWLANEVARLAALPLSQRSL